MRISFPMAEFSDTILWHKVSQKSICPKLEAAMCNETEFKEFRCNKSLLNYSSLENVVFRLIPQGRGTEELRRTFHHFRSSNDKANIRKLNSTRKYYSNFELRRTDLSIYDTNSMQVSSVGQPRS